MFLLKALTINLCFAFVTPASLTKSHSQSPATGYKCGDKFFKEKDLLRTVHDLKDFKSEHHGHLEFDAPVWKIPILESSPSKYPDFIILDSDNDIISVISTSMVDETVDRKDDNLNIFKDYKTADSKKDRSPEMFENYRKCEEWPLIKSISKPESGFDCGHRFLWTEEALKAARLARKMHIKKNKYQKAANSLRYPKTYHLTTLRFNGITPKYSLPINFEGEFKEDGQMSVALDASFNVIGVRNRVSGWKSKCYVSKFVEPRLIGQYTNFGRGKIDGFQCYFGYFKAQRILSQVRSKAPAMFEAKEKNLYEEFPKSYNGGFFPDVSDSLYYIPLVVESVQIYPTFVVLTRFCNVAGVLQMSSMGFRLCDQVV